MEREELRSEGGSRAALDDQSVEKSFEREASGLMCGMISYSAEPYGSRSEEASLLDHPEQERRTMNSPVDLVQRGKQLREDIQALYATMKRDKALRARPHINDVADFMRAYIPEGVSFDDAECILRSAGFNVLERPDINAPHDSRWETRNDRYDVIATLLLPGEFMSRAELMLGMRPKSPGDYTAVSEVRAAIIVTHP